MRKPAALSFHRASRTVELLHEEYKAGAELFMHIGDISYANGQERVRPADGGRELLAAAWPYVLHAAASKCGPCTRLDAHTPHLAQFRAIWQIWDTFMESIEPFARHIPYLVGVGNHGAPQGLGVAFVGRPE